MDMESRVAGHYGQGMMPETGLDDLAGADEFHLRGAEATTELAAALGPGADHVVLDVGSGLGGPSRHVARHHGCRVVGIDLTGEYCRAAARLTARAGLEGRVEFVQGSALDMPFPAAAFDCAYSQHVAMNIADKPRLYAQIRRVLKPGGLFGLYDLLQGPGGDVHFPVPWAREASTSFLVTPDALRALLEGAGFKVMDWRDTSDAARQWMQSLRGTGAGVRPALETLFGADFRQMGRNQARNLEEGRIIPTQVLCRAV